MKFLFIGDYSNFHVSLANELRQMGHHVVVISSGSRCMDTERDIDLRRMPGKTGAIKYLYRIFSLLPQMFGYDVVQLTNPNFFDLKPGKIRYFFKELKRRNKSVFLSLVGNDPFYVKACCDGKAFRYSEYRIGDNPAPFAIANPNNEKEWQTSNMLKFCQYIYDNIDGGMSCLYEYQKVGEQYLYDYVKYIGIPIDIDEIHYEPLLIGDNINIAIGIKSEYLTFKGTDRLLAAARKLEQEYPKKCRVVVLEDMTYRDYMNALRDSHIILDQVYSYTPATNALGAMAMGKIAVSGAEKEFYEFIEESNLHPIVNVLPDDDDIYDKLKSLITLPKEKLIRQGAESRLFVERHNAASLVATRYLNHINRILTHD